MRFTDGAREEPTYEATLMLSDDAAAFIYIYIYKLPSPHKDKVSGRKYIWKGIGDKYNGCVYTSAMAVCILRASRSFGTNVFEKLARNYIFKSNKSHILCSRGEGCIPVISKATLALYKKFHVFSLCTEN